MKNKLIIPLIVLTIIGTTLVNRKIIKPEYIEHTDTVVRLDTIFDTTRIKEPYPVMVEVPVSVIDSILVHRIDTVYVFKEFFSNVAYDTTLVKDSLYKAKIGWVNHMNRSRDFYADISVVQKEKIITKEFVRPETWHLFFGFDATTAGQCLFNLSFQDRAGFIYSGGYDPIQGTYGIGIKAKIK